MTFKEFKELEYPDSLPMENVLADVLYCGKIDFVSAAACYVRALEREKHRKDNLFNEASTVITMALSGNWHTKEKKDTLRKRAIHVFNLNTTFPSNIYDKKYDYTEEDKQFWDTFMKQHYGDDFDK